MVSKSRAVNAAVLSVLVWIPSVVLVVKLGLPWYVNLVSLAVLALVSLFWVALFEKSGQPVKATEFKLTPLNIAMFFAAILLLIAGVIYL